MSGIDKDILPGWGDIAADNIWSFLACMYASTYSGAVPGVDPCEGENAESTACCGGGVHCLYLKVCI